MHVVDRESEALRGTLVGLLSSAGDTGGAQSFSRGACCARRRRQNAVKPRIQCVLTQWKPGFIAFRRARAAAIAFRRARAAAIAFRRAASAVPESRTPAADAVGAADG
jgi:hypothetical protein